MMGNPEGNRNLRGFRIILLIPSVYKEPNASAV